MEEVINLAKQIDKCKSTIEYKTGIVPEDFDIVTFGSYPQNDVTGNIKDPIEWYVLDKKKEKRKALLISKYILDCKEYQEKQHVQKDETESEWWENATLREFLNNEFYNLAFSKDDKENMSQIEIQYKQDKNNTFDNVSCLSFSELDKYLYFWREDKKICYNRVPCKATPYAVSKGLHINEYSGCCGYNVRKPFPDYGLDGWTIWAFHFYNGGYTIEESCGLYPHMFEGVRPVICVKY